MDDPTPALDAEAAPLIQMAWKLGEFYKACRGAGLPDHLTDQVVMDWYTSQIEGQVVWTDLNED
jgi:hypothetical protein